MAEEKKNIIIYHTADGKAKVSLYAKDGSVWMNQNQLAELFDTSKQNIGQHIASILNDNELNKISVVKDYFTTAADGKDYKVTFYSLEMILAIGFRVRSKRGTQFRIWANTTLKEYMVKGFAMDDQRLKNPDGRPDYFDKLLYAVTGHTATEIVLGRADAQQPNMALTSWKGEIVRKQDIYIAKNYLIADEIDTLNRLVVIFLETAELRAKDKLDIAMNFWKDNVDRILTFNDRKILANAEIVTKLEMEEKVEKVYDEFDKRRKAFEAHEADQLDLEELTNQINRIKP